VSATELYVIIEAAERWAAEVFAETGRRIVRAGLPRIVGPRAAVAMHADDALELLLVHDGAWSVHGESDGPATTFAFLSGWYSLGSQSLGSQSLGSQSFTLPPDPDAERWVVSQPTDLVLSALIAPHLRRGEATRSYTLPQHERVAVGFDELWLILDRTRRGYTLRASAKRLTPDVFLHGLTTPEPLDAFERALSPKPEREPVDIATIRTDGPSPLALLGHIQAAVAKTAVPGVAPAELAAAVVSGVADAIAGRPVTATKPIDWSIIARALGLGPPPAAHGAPSARPPDKPE